LPPRPNYKKTIPSRYPKNPFKPKLPPKAPEKRRFSFDSNILRTMEQVQVKEDKEQIKTLLPNMNP
jgi:hypothetical protein